MAKRRRAKRGTRRRRTRAMTAAQRKFFGPRKKRKGHHHMAKRRKRRATKGHRRSTRRRGRRFGGGGGSGLALVKQDIPKMVTAAIYGKVEALAKGDDNFFLNKLPKPINALGYTGNIAALLYIASMFVRHPYVRIAASTVGTIAMYKLGKNGGAFTTSDKTSIGESAYGDSMEGDEGVIDDHTMGALDAEAKEFSSPTRGLAYDDVVREAGTRQ